MKPIFKITLVLLCLMHGIANAQTDPTQISPITPPSPNAAELGRYGDINVGLLTGSANYNIPILSFEDGVSPISIAYSTSGIKVDQIAGRAGMGWALNAGGVVTRQVINKPDEQATMITPAFHVHDATLKNQMELIMLPGSGKDSEADVFNYNFDGYSGKFVLDSARNVVQLPHTNLKISFDVPSYNTSSFTITTPDGKIYLFSAVELSTTTTEPYGEPQQTGIPVATAWYLTSVQLPNGRAINYEYDSYVADYTVGVSESHKRTSANVFDCGSGICPDAYRVSMNRISVYIQGKYLTRISYNSSEMNFSYANRSDVPGDKLLTGIGLKHGNSTIKSVALTYLFAISAGQSHPYFQATELRHRPYLQTLSELGNNGVVVRQHAFTYHDPGALPHRCSFSQDMLGYFNAKGNPETFVPLPELVADRQRFDQATADRSSDPSAAIKGSLATIVYPTGGKDSIEYEGNIANLSKNYPATFNAVGATFLSSENPQMYDSRESAPFSIHDTLGNYKDWTVINGGVMTMIEVDGDPINIADDYLTVELVRVSGNVTIWGRNLKPGESIMNDTIKNLVTGLSYKIRITVLRSHPSVRRYHANVKFVTKAPYTQLEPLQVGGIRVKRIFTMDPFGKMQTKRYYYHRLDQPSTTSSGVARHPDVSLKEEMLYDVGCPAPPGSASTRLLVTCQSEYRFSSSLANLYIFDQTPISYTHVLESIGGDNFEEGGIEHQFEVQAHQPGRPIMGFYFIPGSKTSYSAQFHGLEMYTNYFRKSGSSFLSVKTEQHNYEIDSQVGKIGTSHGETVTSYEVRKRYAHPQIMLDLSGYDVLRYFYNHRWVKKTSTTITEYNDAGVAILSRTQDFTYDNLKHTQVTRSAFTDSRGILNEETYTYPHEMATQGRDPNGIYQEMINRNIISPVIEQISLKAGIQSAKVITNYSRPHTNIYRPANIQVQQLTNTPLETRVQFHNYDVNGNILSVSKDGGTRKSYIWAHSNTYPISEAINSDLSQIAYTSFEDNVTGYWSGVNPANIVTTQSLTGKRSYSQSGFSLSKTGLTASTQYIVSYWSRNASAYSVSGTIGNAAKGRSASGWTYYEHRVTGVSGITVTGSGFIDELRCYPRGAQMATYSYDPLVGHTSQCEANNIVTYFEYDAFQRLTLVRDLDRYAVKKYCYNYAGQVENCDGVITYRSAERAQSFTRNNCPAGGTSQPVLYRVNAGKYSSTISQTDADQQAQTDLINNGQQYANDHGVCLFVNDAASGSFTRNNCSPGGVPGSVTYTISAGTYTSTISKADANQQAQSALAAGGQNYANTHAVCTFYNLQQSGVYYRNNCPPGQAGSAVTYTVAPGTFSSTVDLYSANQLAINHVAANGQNYANTHGTCTSAVCSFTMSSGFTQVSSQIENVGSGTINFYLAFYPSSNMVAGNSYTIATINGGCRPTTTRHVTATYGGRTWNVSIFTTGVVQVSITNGGNLNAGNSGYIGGSFNL